MSDQRYRVIADGNSCTSEIPKGKNIYYRCALCDKQLPSQPHDNMGCDCGNVFIDIDSFKVAARNLSAFLVVERI